MSTKVAPYPEVTRSSDLALALTIVDRLFLKFGLGTHKDLQILQFPLRVL